VPASTSVPAGASYAPDHQKGIPSFLDKQETTMMTTKIKAAMLIAANLRIAALNGSRRAAAFLLMGLTLAACSAAQDVNVAQEAAAHFHEMMSAGQLEQIYAQSDDSFKKVTTPEYLTRFLSVVNGRLGVVMTSESIGWTTGYTPSGTFITLRYTTKFEHGTGTETFLYRSADGKVLLAGYHIDSIDLIAAPQIVGAR
jgi:hypothetical protein